MSKRISSLFVLLLVGFAVLSQVGCAPLAAGVAGGVIGHEAAKRHDHDDDDD